MPRCEGHPPYTRSHVLLPHLPSGARTTRTAGRRWFGFERATSSAVLDAWTTTFSSCKRIVWNGTHCPLCYTTLPVGVFHTRQDSGPTCLARQGVNQPIPPAQISSAQPHSLRRLPAQRTGPQHHAGRATPLTTPHELGVSCVTFQRAGKTRVPQQRVFHARRGGTPKPVRIRLHSTSIHLGTADWIKPATRGEAACISVNRRWQKIQLKRRLSDTFPPLATAVLLTFYRPGHWRHLLYLPLRSLPVLYHSVCLIKQDCGKKVVRTQANTLVKDFRWTPYMQTYLLACWCLGFLWPPSKDSCTHVYDLPLGSCCLPRIWDMCCSMPRFASGRAHAQDARLPSPP